MSRLLGVTIRCLRRPLSAAAAEIANHYRATPARLRRVALACVLVAAAVAALAGAASATVGLFLDQQQTNTTDPVITQLTYCAADSTTNSPDCSATAQTFTAGLTGGLAQVDLDLWGDNFLYPVTVQIRNVDASGAPGTTVLAQSGVVVSGGPDWTPVTFASPASVHAGTRYAIVVFYDTGIDSVGWVVNLDGDPYPAGAAYASNTASPSTWTSWTATGGDLTFRTYVDGADLAAAMTGPSTAPSHSPATYTITISNRGPEAASNVVLTDNLPYGAQFKDISSSQGSCTPPAKGSYEVTCQLGDIANGDAANSTVTVRITAHPSQGYVNNVASVTSDTVDPDLSNNTTAFSTAVTKK